MFDVGPEITQEDVNRFVMLKDIEAWEKRLLIQSQSPVPSDDEPSGVLSTDS